MNLALAGGLAILVGVALIVFRKPFSRVTIDMQNVIRAAHMSEREVVLNEVVAVIVGIGFLMGGLLNLRGARWQCAVSPSRAMNV